MRPECGQWTEWATPHGEDEPAVLRPQPAMTDRGLKRRFARRRAARSGLRRRPSRCVSPWRNRTSVRETVSMQQVGGAERHQRSHDHRHVRRVSHPALGGIHDPRRRHRHDGGQPHSRGHRLRQPAHAGGAAEDGLCREGRPMLKMTGLDREERAWQRCSFSLTYRHPRRPPGRLLRSVRPLHWSALQIPPLGRAGTACRHSAAGSGRGGRRDGPACRA